jgi:hypothetical protein
VTGVGIEEWLLFPCSFVAVGAEVVWREGELGAEEEVGQGDRRRERHLAGVP